MYLKKAPMNCSDRLRVARASSSCGVARYTLLRGAIARLAPPGTKHDSRSHPARSFFQQQALVLTALLAGDSDGKDWSLGLSRRQSRQHFAITCQGLVDVVSKDVP